MTALLRGIVVLRGDRRLPRLARAASPRALLRDVGHAEAAGFHAISSSDHFTPWSERQGESGFAWSWLGAAMQATSLPFGVVNAPGQRYHPAIIAQAIATLLELFPDRLWVAMGPARRRTSTSPATAGPRSRVRNERLRRVRRRRAGAAAGRGGQRRRPRPRRPGPAVDAARRGAAALRRGVERGDGAVVRGVGRRAADRRPCRPTGCGAVIDAFRDGGGDGKPVRVQAKVAWAPTTTRRWPAPSSSGGRTCSTRRSWPTSSASSSSRSPPRTSAPTTCARGVRCPPTSASTPAYLHELLDCGVDELFVHHVPRPQDGFIDAYGDKVLPELTS